MSRPGTDPIGWSLTGALQRDTYAHLPLIVVGAYDAAQWAELEGPRRMRRMPAAETLAQLTAVVEEALTEQGMAV